MRIIPSLLSSTALVGTALCAFPAYPQSLSVVDGGGHAGAVVQDSRTVGSRSGKTAYTNFYTEGGAGSGGGAGLGGAFFVDEGASLTVVNTDFRGNTAKGGQGGSRPPVELVGSTLLLADLKADIAAVESLNPTPQLTYTGLGYEVSGVELTGENAAIRSGVSAMLGGAAAPAEIASISGTTVTFAAPVVIDHSKVTFVATDIVPAGETKFDIMGFGGDANNFKIGSVVVGSGVPQGARIVEVEYDANREPISVTLDQASVATVWDFDVVNVGSLSTPQFKRIDAQTIQMGANASSLAVGMEVVADGVPPGVYVTSISNSGEVAFSAPVPPTFTGFVGRIEAAKAGSSVVTLPKSSGALSVGMPISGTGVQAGTVISAIDGNRITLSQPLTATPEALRTTLATGVSVFGGFTSMTIAAGQDISSGMSVSGPGIPDGARVISYNRATGALTVDRAVSGSVTGLTFASPLSVGGAMNGLGLPGVNGANGAGGANGNLTAAWYNGGEGQDGTNGKNAGSAGAGVGGNGGGGGKGSDGMPFNKDLILALADTTE